MSGALKLLHAVHCLASSVVYFCGGKSAFWEDCLPKCKDQTSCMYYSANRDKSFSVSPFYMRTFSHLKWNTENQNRAHKIRDRVNMDVLRMNYFAFIHPHSIEICGNTYQTHLSKLMILYIKLFRILQNQSIKTPIVNLYKTFNTLPLPLLREYRILNFVHTFINNKEKWPVIFESYLFRLNVFIPMIQVENVIYIWVAYS